MPVAVPGVWTWEGSDKEVSVHHYDSQAKVFEYFMFLSDLPHFTEGYV